MSDPLATVNGHTVTHARVYVPNLGAWHAELELEQAPELSGRVTLKVAGLVLSGTVDASASGAFGEKRTCRVVAGAGGWATELAPKNYHNDARVKALHIAQDAAREAGEQLGNFVPTAERVGVDYVRQRGPASTVLEAAAGGATWWVDYAGVTQVGPRPSVPLDPATYSVLAYDGMSRQATLAVDDASKIPIGGVLTDRLDAPRVVRSLELVATPSEVRLLAWCGGDDTTRGQLAELLTSIVEHVVRSRLFGKYRYRVVRRSVDRVELQAVSTRPGLPDLLPVSMVPGVAGAHAELAAGAHVFVEFVEGDRAQPIVTGFAGKDGTGHVPDSLTLCGSGQRAARQGDLVQSGGVGCSVILTGAPLSPAGGLLPGVPYLCSFTTNPLDVGPLAKPLFGAISTGSPKVKA